MTPQEQKAERANLAAAQAAHFVEACGKSNVKLVTIRRADLQRAIYACPQNELTAYLSAKASEAETKYVSVNRAKLLAGCATIVEAAQPAPVEAAPVEVAPVEVAPEPLPEQAPDAPPADHPASELPDNPSDPAA